MISERLRDILSERRPLVTNFPSWLISPTTLKELRKLKGVAVAEIAGRDSLAAVLKATEEEDIRAILPTIAYTGTEFGDWNIPYEKALSLKNLKRKDIKVFKPIFLGDPRLWWRLCGRPLGQLIKKFGFYTPCLGCHLYLHIVRVPLARLIGARLIIAGERETHDGRIKLNQLPVALDAYESLLKEVGLRLVLPLRKVDSGAEIERILGRPWGEGAEQMSCVLSQNYLDEAKRPVSEEGIEEILQNFLIPEAQKWLAEHLSGLA
ncbi:hypothetical protein G4V39_07090 [Thermosulfuriphilus ammonigenes]|uniref:Uncharacterized protein n=1 Tax=Thermosulfuriphilus ammonigenes TaxID=1936021 RepID=A0A6G7PXA3_9BACT|nr:hypothetical protein [Thermosulfuriphilus ammonigenes]MBA2847752.1 hypothetical protein [Thermosulfuriphilus ammonigenes]QIJ72043.1 hypothetical protein G4V39_07090 [Thermosulfuriphilus ammonigenes]